MNTIDKDTAARIADCRAQAETLNPETSIAAKRKTLKEIGYTSKELATNAATIEAAKVERVRLMHRARSLKADAKRGRRQARKAA